MAASLGFGVPLAVVCGLIFASDYGNGVWLLVVPCAAIAAYVWAEVMWRIMFRDFYAMKRRAAEERDAQLASKPK